MIKMAEVSALKSKKINKTQYLQTKMTQWNDACEKQENEEYGGYNAQRK